MSLCQMYVSFYSIVPESRILQINSGETNLDIYCFLFSYVFFFLFLFSFFFCKLNLILDFLHDAPNFFFPRSSIILWIFFLDERLNSVACTYCVVLNKVLHNLLPVYINIHPSTRKIHF